LVITRFAGDDINNNTRNIFIKFSLVMWVSAMVRQKFKIEKIKKIIELN